MKIETKEKLWNIFFSILFVVLVIHVGIEAQTQNSFQLEVFEFIILSLATFRLIRLFVYDRIMLFLRDIFTFKEPTGLCHTCSKLLGCPWCFGVWATLIVVTLYTIVPYGQFLVFLLAIAGVGSILQLLANLIGWSAEKKKIEVKNLE